MFPVRYVIFTIRIIWSASVAIVLPIETSSFHVRLRSEWNKPHESVQLC